MPCFSGSLKVQMNRSFDGPRGAVETLPGEDLNCGALAPLHLMKSGSP